MPFEDECGTGIDDRRHFHVLWNFVGETNELVQVNLLKYHCLFYPEDRHKSGETRECFALPGL